MDDRRHLPPPPPDDALALVAALARDARARLAAAARRQGLRPEDAVDAVHDALCTLLRLAQRGAIPSADELVPFATTLVVNAARNRRRRHHLERPHDPLDDDGPKALAAAGNAETALAAAEAHVRLHACVERLCDTQKAVVTLRMLEEVDGTSAAEALGITRGHVDVLLHRAKRSLLVCLAEDAAGP